MDNLEAVLQASREHFAQVQKSGNDSFYNAVQAATAQRLRQQALNNAGLLALVGLGTGAAGRGLAGLVQLANRNIVPPRTTVPSPAPIDIPLEEEKHAGLADFIQGDYAQSIQGVPWAIPAAVGAGTAGVAGGWTLMDQLLDRRRKGDLDAELEKAKQEYETALVANAHKTASLSSELDELYDTLEKKADYWSDMAGRGMGYYGLYGGLSGLVGAMLAYNWGKKRQRRALINDALKVRRRRRFANQPAALYVRPDTGIGANPTESPTMRTAPAHEETEGLDL